MAIIGTSYFFYTNGVPVVNGTVAPTAAQAFLSNQVICQLTAGDADTTCTITHNMALTTAQLNNLLSLPLMAIDGTSLGTVMPVLKYTLSANSIAVTKMNTVAGSGGTYNLTINRPLGATL